MLQQHEFGRQPKLWHLWNQVQWQEVPRDETGRAANPIPGTGPLVIALYPPLLQVSTEQAQYEVLKAFGNTLLAVAGKRAADVWAHKYVLPEPAQIEAVQSRLQDALLRQRCRRYADLVQEYPEKGSAADRLVMVHVANALIANNIPYEDSVGVDIREWGPTAEYCTLKRYHSIIPLVTHYCPSDVATDYGAAFALTVLQGKPPCADSSVQRVLHRLVASIVARLDAYPDVL